MRSIWSGSISFGLINIPVQLFSWTKEHAFEFDMLHKKDMSPIRYAKICKAEEKEISNDEIVKGYEYEKGQYVVVTNEDFEAAHPKKAKTIEIQFFTDAGSIDSIYFEKPYILTPGKSSDKAYALLREALRRSGEVAICTFTIHSREHMGILKPHKNAIILNQLRYQSEIRSDKDFELPAEIKISPKELNMALELVKHLTDSFKPEKYKDHYVEELQAIINAKLKGRKLRPKKVKEPEAIHVEDIMAKLKESLKKYKEPSSTHHKTKRAYLR